MNISIRPLTALGLVLVAAAGGALAQTVASVDHVVTRPFRDLQFRKQPGRTALVAEGWQAPNGSHCEIARLARGQSVGLHTHSAPISYVVMQGQFANLEEGQPQNLVGPNSYQFVPAGVKHTTKCGPDSDCIFFSCQPAPYDIKTAVSSTRSGSPGMP